MFFNKKRKEATAKKGGNGGHFHITVVDNDTGETQLDLDTNAIVGSVFNEDRPALMVWTRCNVLEAAGVARAAQEAAEKTINQMPKELREILSHLKVASEEETATDETEGGNPFFS